VLADCSRFHFFLPLASILAACGMDRRRLARHAAAAPVTPPLQRRHARGAALVPGAAGESCRFRSNQPPDDRSTAEKVAYTKIGTFSTGTSTWRRTKPPGVFSFLTSRPRLSNSGSFLMAKSCTSTAE
jgi:hypothetical protein